MRNNISLSAFALGYVFWYGIAFLNTTVTNLGDIYIANITFLVFILLTYFIFRENSKIPDTLKLVISPSFIFITLFIFFLIFLLKDFAPGMIKYHMIRAESAISILIFIFLFSQQRSLVMRFFLAFLVLFIAINLSGSYSRRPLLIFLAVPLVIMFLLNARKPGSSLIVMLICFVAFTLIAYVTFLRSGFEFSLNSLIMYGFVPLAYGEGFDVVVNHLYVLETYNESNFLLGESFLAGIFNIIPREIWTDKPEAFGIVISSQYFNLNSSEIFTNFGPGLIAESYANFGFYGYIFVPVVLGFCLAKFDNYICSAKYINLWKLIAIIIVTTGVFFLVRGDFVNGFYEIYFKYLFVFFFIHIYSIIFGSFFKKRNN